ncbi:MAG: 2-C-methyl-D-erythritol 2,4-cyclodiphosphate synthase [Desulfotomaculum sp.]|nr:2-C-methyl-D-erythritol 2,4-cyclodiphosphate synthase [Desulfotomaculum sp.]
MRVGIGFDVHRLEPGRPLIVGGVDIPYSRGLMGHSDADVLVHAVMDALLGAAGKGDIGRHFPDDDETYKGISSLELLRQVREIIAAAGYRVNNIDAVIIAQAPRMSPHIRKMEENIARVLEIEVEKVNVKATTTEKLGFTGEGKGIAAQAVVLII